jgi:hypothetical protein
MAYIGKSPAGLGVRARYYYTATGGETSISGADDNGRTLQFTDGEYVDVYLNGVLLVAGTDYGTGTANTISGLDALSAGNIVEIVAYDIFSLGKANTEALRRRYYKTATGGETSISGSDDNGLTITFAANAELEVYLNGVALVQGDDYNTSTANTVGGLSALDADDIVTIVAYEEFVLGDVVSKKSGGTFGNNISVDGSITTNSGTLKHRLNHSDDLDYVIHRFITETTDENKYIIAYGAGNSGSGLDNQIAIKSNDSAGTIAFHTNSTERMRIDSSGCVAMPNQPTFHARRTSLSALASGNNITYDATYINKGSHYNTTNGRFTAPVAGAYLFFWDAIGNNTSSVYRLHIYQNGVKAGNGDMHIRQDTTASGSEYATNASRTVILDLNANDYVYIGFASTTGTGLYSGNDYLTFGGYLIG